jgi:deoxyribodipyrimidine photolyase-related protein
MKRTRNETATLIFPHQLFEEHPNLDTDRSVILIEDPRFFTDFAFHTYKLILHRASMQAYKEHLLSNGYEVLYIEFDNTIPILKKILQTKGVTTLYCVDMVDHTLEKKYKDLCNQLKIELIVANSPGFLTTSEIVEKTFGSKKKFLMHSFYIQQRKRLRILVTDGKPVGGTWSFDAQNRKALAPGTKIPTLWLPKINAYVKEAQKYIKKYFPNNPGSTDDFFYPVTFSDARQWLNDFLKHRLATFGDFQDAIDPQHPYMFHSLLSPLINIGLLTPSYVLQETLHYAKKHTIPLNSLEGFIRQLIGWREYVRAVYMVHGEKQRSENIFGHTLKLSPSWWTATTGIEPIDTTIKQVLKTGYAHHIERLMILGNFMLLSRTDPNEVYKWFMELFIDAYDWVMVPNVYGMSQFADGPITMTKPYISSAAYIQKMSAYPAGEWCTIWTALYWNFLTINKKFLSKNGRMLFAYKALSTMKKETLKKHIDIAHNFFKTLS